VSVVNRLFTKCLLRPEDIPATSPELRVIGVFNPGVVQRENRIVLLARVAEAVKPLRPGFIGLPRWEPGAPQPVVDWVEEKEVEWPDPRLAFLRRTGRVRLPFVSHLRKIELDWNLNVISVGEPTLIPQTEWEEFGVEDPRITELDGRFWVTYVAVSTQGIVTALASTTDFQQFDRVGIVFAPENKDVVLFPEKVDGLYWAFHRPMPQAAISVPEIWLARSPDLIYWGRHQVFLRPSHGWESSRIGAGAPPWRTERGWLFMYHGSEKVPYGVGPYRAALVWLDGDDPTRIIGRSPVIFEPETEFERQGFVPNVVFPTGVIHADDEVWVFYGASDTYVGVTAFREEDLFRACEQQGLCEATVTV